MTSVAAECIVRRAGVTGVTPSAAGTPPARDLVWHGGRRRDDKAAATPTAFAAPAALSPLGLCVCSLSAFGVRKRVGIPSVPADGILTLASYPPLPAKATHGAGPRVASPSFAALSSRASLTPCGERLSSVATKSCGPLSMGMGFPRYWRGGQTAPTAVAPSASSAAWAAMTFDH